MFQLSKLSYAYDALEPYIDAQTMETHYAKHYQGYTDKLNAAVQGTEREQETIEEILINIDKLPAEKKLAIVNNGGGYYNHNLFWDIMTPNGTKIPAEFVQKLVENFGSVEDFKQEFSTAAATNFGSGRTRLVKDKSGKLSIMNTSNQDCPISHELTPILALDIWEHAYYLKYQNRRPEYIQQRRNVINWEQVEKNYNN